MEKFNVVLEETVKRVTTVAVEVKDEDELYGVLEELDEIAEDTDSYISMLRRKSKVFEVTEHDEELKDFECSDYYKYTEEK